MVRKRAQQSMSYEAELEDRRDLMRKARLGDGHAQSEPDGSVWGSAVLRKRTKKDKSGAIVWSGENEKPGTSEASAIVMTKE